MQVSRGASERTHVWLKLPHDIKSNMSTTLAVQLYSECKPQLITPQAGWLLDPSSWEQSSPSAHKPAHAPFLYKANPTVTSLYFLPREFYRHSLNHDMGGHHRRKQFGLRILAPIVAKHRHHHQQLLADEHLDRWARCRGSPAWQRTLDAISQPPSTKCQQCDDVAADKAEPVNA